MFLGQKVMDQARRTQRFGWYHGLGRCWEAALDLWAVLNPMQFSIVVLVAGAILLLFLQQAQDALYVVVAGAMNLNARAISRLFLFAALTFYWAFNTFYAARFMSRLPPSGRVAQIVQPSAEQTRPTHLYLPPLLPVALLEDLNRHLPRVLGALVMVAVYGSLFRASLRLPVSVTVSVVVLGAAMLALYYWVVRNRRRLTQAFGRGIGQPEMFTIADTMQRDLGRGERLPPWCAFLVVATVLIVLAALLGSIWFDREIPYSNLWVAMATLASLAVGLIALGQSDSLPYSTKWFVGAQTFVTVLMFLLSLVPQWPFVTEVLGSPAVVVIAAAAWAFGGTLFLAYPAKITRLPIVLGFIVIAALAGLAQPHDNHIIRQTDNQVTRSFATDDRHTCRRLSHSPTSTSGEAKGAKFDPFAQAFDRWCNVAAARWGPKGRIPLVIIATAGGASRAAYWTEKVLGELEARVPGFHDYVFAISSVSGGTLGSAVYRLSLDLPHPSSPPGEPPPLPGTECKIYTAGVDPAPCALAMLQQDFLSSLLLGGLYSDLVQRFLPGALLPDRALALERSWEREWASFFPQQESWLRDGFLARMNAFLATPDTWRPLLFFNGTSVLTGRRVITSTLPIDGHFSDSIDYFGWVSQKPELSRDIPISTAIHNSARFPFLDAAGDVLVNGSVVDRIVDGGYFENYGAATALDVLEQLIDRDAVGLLDETASDEVGKRTIDPIIIQISNDASVPPRLPLGNDAPAPRSKLEFPLKVLSDVSNPPVAFYDTRYGLGQRATDVLRTRLAYLRANGANDARYVHFQIGDDKIPMSWLLSNYAGALIDKQLPLGEPSQACDETSAARPACNVDEFNRLLDILKPSLVSANR